MSNIATLLEKLEKVRQVSPGRWMAACPIHEDRRPSLSIRHVEEDGRILLNCFSCGTGAVEIMQTIGLGATDLFERPSTHEPRKLLSIAPGPRELLAMIDHEALVVMMLAEGVIENRAIGPEVFDRLAAAVRRIGWARDQACPAKVRADAGRG